ncbi:eCIS core domain-containing protein [Streptomyces huasconensis]|uniref:eCIS core domain-containing protein n=1 Tax=Streptomyces huasconensis TaxID=1854574 RepID=UPI0033CC27C8
MHQHDHTGTTGAEKGRGPARRPAAGGTTPPAGLLALQRGAGNAAVVQMLRQAGHPWSQEAHRHGAGCGHGAQQPQVQRSAVHDVLRGAGKPLDDATRTDMESRLGADFSDVRVHDDAAARASAAEVGARAYTSGSHVVIGAGGADKHTLAHELTHVIQQRQGPVAGTDNGAGLKVSDPSDRFEREAEANARRAMAGGAAGPRAEQAPAPAPDAPSTGIQRYVSGNVKGLASEESDEPFFQSQSPQGVLVPDPERLSKHSVDHVGAQTHDPFRQDLPKEQQQELDQRDGPKGLPLRVAGDGTLAVHDTEREPKEFYATEAVLAASNTALEDVNSTYRLVGRGQKITVQNPANPAASVKLERIQPVPVETPQAAASGFANLLKHECIDVARELMGGGKQTEVVLEGREPLPWQDSTVDSVAHGLADQVGADQGPTPQRYGGALREHPAEMDAAAGALGVNKAAAPVVGEGYTTVSLGQSDKLDYADSATPEARPQDIWGFHFAGVAAMSADGQDRVTLENYTRTANSGDALRELLPRLVEEFKKKTAIPLLRPGGRTPPASPFEMDRLNKLLRELSGSAAKATEEFKRLSEAKNEWNSKWFFRMYGSGAGQTFHEQQYNNGRGDFVNPLTLRVRKPRPQEAAS